MSEFVFLIVSLQSKFSKGMETEKIIDANKQGHPLLTEAIEGNKKKLYIESYGCQMNLNDSEIVASILAENDFNTTQYIEDADLVLVNTCSIRDKAEQTIRKRLQKVHILSHPRVMETKAETPFEFKRTGETSP